MAKYKDYPIYTYDEPATYSDFSGGINTDPSNEHLQPNEMRDCLNMHFKSAALVKRKGASLLCNIQCDEELFTIQGVFLFTYRITYIIIAADGKLYKGVYSPLSTIRLSRLPIYIEVPETLAAFNPIDTSVGLDVRVSEDTDQKHEGFVLSYSLDELGKRVLLEDYFLGDYSSLTTISDNQVVRYKNAYYKLSFDEAETVKQISRQVIYPTNTKYWISLQDYNTLYREDILKRTDLLSINESNNYMKTVGVSFDVITNTWREQGYNSDSRWISTGTPPVWTERTEAWVYGTAVTYNNTIYICKSTHTNYIAPPDSGYATATASWIKLTEQKELIFQNHSPIESATYNNKMYLATGTRFVEISLRENELVAHTVVPYSCNTTEITNIGYNYLSPYPELCRSTQYNQSITSIGGIIATKNIYGRYTLTPQMNFAQGESEHDYYFKWEKKIGDEWFVIYSYKDNIYENHDYEYIEDPEGDFTYSFNSTPEENAFIEYDESMGDVPRFSRKSKGFTPVKLNLYTIEVTDADKYQYRVSFAKDFEKAPENTKEWDYNTEMYTSGTTVSVKTESGKLELYKCVKSHRPQQVVWDNIEYEFTDYTPSEAQEGLYEKTYKKDSAGDYIIKTSTPVFSATTTTKTGVPLYNKIEKESAEDLGTPTIEYQLLCHDTTRIIKGATYWEPVLTEEAILTPDGVKYDWSVDKITGSYFGQGSSTIISDLEINDMFLKINSCKKILSDGNKFLLYDDRYNSGSWYKTIINNPSYITDRGGLSFKTNKNESLIKVVSFNGNLIAFANADNVGGSIHMITGNGDDWDDQSGYYSPYRRSTINATVSCDNANTVQVCENILVFKYFDTLYYISGSELNNEVVSVYSCNDRIKHNNNFVRIPWDDNSCISEVTEDYYALIWKEKYSIQDEDLILERPALKVKMYYKLGTQQNEKIVYPWLRDESDYFNIDHILYIKGKPIYLYNNTLTTFHNEVYTDYDKIYTCQVHFRGEDLNYPKMIKLLSNIMVYYHRNQYSKIDFDLKVKNEAGHILLDSSRSRSSLQDLRALRAGDTLVDGEVRLDSTILDSKVFNCAYKFPCLLADSTITATNNKEFSISSITYNYLTAETPDQTQYDLYTNILRPQDTYVSIQEALNTSVLETQVSKPEEVGRAIETTKVVKKEDGSHEVEVGININERRDTVSVKLSDTDYVENLESNLDTATADMDDMTAFLEKINSGEGYDKQ